jgi:hypothetical protein
MGDVEETAKDRLIPLEYHENLVAYLKVEERAVWEWSQSADVRKQQADEMRDAMLRQTYRMEPESHPEVYASCHAAMETLGIQAPVTLYQAADGMMNAALCFIPGEVHLIFYGPILEKLSGEELLALMGHELAHYRLWTTDDGSFYNASRILDHSMSYAMWRPPTANPHDFSAYIPSYSQIEALRLFLGAPPLPFPFS